MGEQEKVWNSIGDGKTPMLGQIKRGGISRVEVAEYSIKHLLRRPNWLNCWEERSATGGDQVGMLLLLPHIINFPKMFLKPIE